MPFAFADLRLSAPLAMALSAIVVGASAPADARLGRAPTTTTTSSAIDAAKRSGATEVLEGGSRGARAEAIGPAERASIGARLAYVLEAPGTDQRRAWLASAEGREERALDDGAGDSYPAGVTRDGSVLVIHAEGDEERHVESLELVDPTSGRRDVIASGTRVRHPSVSTDDAIAFESDAVSFRDLFVARRGKGESRITDNPEGNYEPSFFPDGRSLVFTSSRDFDAEIYAMSADGKSPRRLTASAGDDMQPLVSPDGRQIAFISGRSGEDRIFVMGPNGEEQRVVRRTAPEESEREHAWSPDGRNLVFVARPRENMKSRIMLWDAARDVVTQLTDGSAVCDMPAFSPDGRHIAFVSDEGGAPDLWLMRRDGSGAVRVFDREPTGEKRWLPTWVPAPRRP